ncbi:hypothetical protein P3T23_002262 [Paraburkholderia sp. GAS448]|jgi:hypothetical protein|uniref:hypothetical protein n=1 Tax=Paraburkholderia sp. GAS448 TaxID=3035136 RepID=UPI003D19A784
MTPLRYIDLPVFERAAFELACARRGFAPMHFEITGFAETTGATPNRLVTVRRGRWAQSYRAHPACLWVKDFESDLTCNFFR